MIVKKIINNGQSFVNHCMETNNSSFSVERCALLPFNKNWCAGANRNRNTVTAGRSRMIHLMALITIVTWAHVYWAGKGWIMRWAQVRLRIANKKNQWATTNAKCEYLRNSVYRLICGQASMTCCVYKNTAGASQYPIPQFNGSPIYPHRYMCTIENGVVRTWATSAPSIQQKRWWFNRERLTQVGDWNVHITALDYLGRSSPT
jgi:hypothetical protein